ncbi:Centromere protein V [Rhynchospora pubera]|uniref:Centromere protein V n=1 Tax=Rhynchospora pubera TaxID=906938 RepID=A0AAV8BS63_9POAL|nr:Centromere protein V [Rhynchospora pubera]
MSAEFIHTGGCHCKSVRWQVEAPASVVALECNCSYCSMRGTSGFSVPSFKFKLIGDSNNFISTYSFNTHTARHTFCKVCGITSFYTPRSNPPGNAVTVVVSCVDPGTISHVEIRHFDGRDFEKAIEHLAQRELK